MTSPGPLTPDPADVADVERIQCNTYFVHRGQHAVCTLPRGHDGDHDALGNRRAAELPIRGFQ